MSAFGRVATEGEDVAELVLDGAGVGEHAMGSWPPAVAGVEQDSLADPGDPGDPGESGGQFAHAQVQAGAGGLEPYQVGDLQGEYAGEDVDADVVPGPVEHRGDRDHARVFELPEAELGRGLGAVPGDHLAGRPVVVIGDQDMLAEQVLFQGGAGAGVDAPGEPQVLGLAAVELPGDHAPHPGLAGDRGFDLAAGPAGLAAGQGAASSSSFGPAFASVVPSNPRAW